MTLYIQLDGSINPITHPSEESNLKMIYTVHDWFYGPPSGWVEFIRVKPPFLGAYQVWDESIGADICMAFDHNGLEYKLVDGKFKDVWHVLELTDAEKKAKQDAVKASYADGEIPSSWVFDESKCQYAPPVAFPSDGKTYAWKESTKEWLEYPSDGKNYEWDNSDESWKERTE